jgi:hypothetical protein
MFVGAESFNPATLAAAHKFHNTPEKYAEIVRLCREHGITSHFSNILGFPDDTERRILEHLSTLRALAPDVASFYILTPVPGTEQYADFRRLGLLTEENLDRFDGAAMTWSHPRLSGPDLVGLLFRCYREFYSAPDVAARFFRVARATRDFRRGAALGAVAGYSAQSRRSAWRRVHPMAGGTWPVRRDSERDYRGLRLRTYGLARAPLPENLALSAADEEANRAARLSPPA